MGFRTLILLLVAVLSACPLSTFCSTIEPSAVVVGQGDFRLYAEPAEFGNRLVDEDSGAAQTLPLVFSPTKFGCQPMPARSEPFVLVAQRGQCNFTRKGQLAYQAGAASLVVANSLEGIYAASSVGDSGPAINTTQCDYDCSQGMGWVPASSATEKDAYRGYNCSVGRCGSNKCLLTGQSRNGGAERQVCCLADDFMDIGGTPVPIPVVFVTVAGAQALSDYDRREVAAGRVTAVKVAYRHTPNIDASTFLIWLLGVAAVGIASWRSTSAEREALSARPVSSGSEAPASSDASVETVEITVKAAVLFLVFASVFLLLLFMLIKLGVSIVLIIIAFFSFGSVSSVSYIALRPICLRLFPSLKPRTFQCGPCGDVPGYAMVAAPFAIGLVVTWILTRHSSTAFILQDFFGICLCCLFLLQIRLPDIKVASVLLILFFFYDIFMVFLSPLLFNSSVMVDVATAGMPTAVVNQACYCRLNPDDSAHCGDGELMPILLRLPRVNDYRGGNAMLGLGDIVMPGLLLSFALRYDYVSAGTMKRGYFWTTWIGYAVGLMCANLAVIFMKQGQPALLYLVPCTLGPFCLLAHKRGELRTVWGSRDRAESNSSEVEVPLTQDIEADMDTGSIELTETRDRKHHGE